MYDIQLFGRSRCAPAAYASPGRDFGGVKPRHILALLALRGALHKSELTELLWNGRPPANHVATVESYVSLLRHRLDPTATTRDSVITTSNGGYALVADRVRVDVARFDELVAAASGRTARRALPPLTAAAHLADRPLLVDEQPDWATSARSRYRIRLVGTLLRRGRARPGRPAEPTRGADAGRPGGGARSGRGTRLAHHDGGAPRARGPGRRRCRRTTGAGASWPTGWAWSRPRRPGRCSWSCCGPAAPGTAVDDAVAAVLAAARRAGPARHGRRVAAPGGRTGRIDRAAASWSDCARPECRTARQTSRCAHCARTAGSGDLACTWPTGGRGLFDADRRRVPQRRAAAVLGVRLGRRPGARPLSCWIIPTWCAGRRVLDLATGSGLVGDRRGPGGRGRGGGDRRRPGGGRGRAPKRRRQRGHAGRSTCRRARCGAGRGRLLHPHASPSR